MQHLIRPVSVNPRVHIDNVGIGPTSPNLALQNTAILGSGIVADHNHEHALAFLSASMENLMQKMNILNNSALFERKHFAAISYQGDGVVGDALTDGNICRIADPLRNRRYVPHPSLVQIQGSFGLQYFQDRRIETLARNLAATNRVENGPVTRIQVSGHGKHIVPCLEGIHSGTPDVSCVEAGQSRHVEGVGDHDSLKIEFVLEQTVNDGGGRRSHEVGIGIKGWYSDVRRHNSVHSGFDRLAERRQVDGAQHRQILVDSWYGKVRVGPGIAVTGEVLGGSQHSVRSRAAYVGGDQRPYLLRVGSECAGADNGIRRVRIHVGDGEKVPVHADRSAFLGRNATELLGVGHFAGRPKGHGVRKYGCAKKTRRKDALLKVSGDQKGHLRFFL